VTVHIFICLSEFKAVYSSYVNIWKSILYNSHSHKTLRGLNFYV
jgi:hypothetical protein